MRSRTSVFRHCCSALAILAAIACLRAQAAEYDLTASGPITSILSYSLTFDGTTSGELPPLLDIERLEGGSFTATYRFSTVTPASGTSAGYALSASSMMQFDLLDASGEVVHHGGDSSDLDAYVANNYGAPPFSVDQVLLSAVINTISGSHIPAPLNGQVGDVFSIGDINCADYVGGGIDYLTDLAIPTDAATYLAFTHKNFDVVFAFGDGDYANMVGPYRYVETDLTYEIALLTVTPVHVVPGGACCVSDATGSAGFTCVEAADAGACAAMEFVCNVADHMPPTFAGCYGDADGNGFVNAGDRGFVSANIGQTDAILRCKFDMDGNGFINPGDRGFVSANIGLCTPLPDWQDGSGLNHGAADDRFGAATFHGVGSTCAEATCE